jgi:hypothetical protein
MYQALPVTLGGAPVLSQSNGLRENNLHACFCRTPGQWDSGHLPADNHFCRYLLK